MNLLTMIVDNNPTGFIPKFRESESRGVYACVHQIFLKSYIMRGIQIWEDQGLFPHFKLLYEELGQPRRIMLSKKRRLLHSFGALLSWIISECFN